MKQFLQKSKKLVASDLKINWYKSFFCQIDEPALLVDLLGNIMLVNPAFEEKFGLTEEEATGISIMSYMKDYQDFYKMVQQILQGKEQNFQFMFKRKVKGKILPAKVKIKPVYDDSDEIMALLVVIEDITKEVEYETLIQMQNETLESEENLLMDITKNINEMIGLFDLENRKFLYVSPAFQKKIGINPLTFFKNPSYFFDVFEVNKKRRLLTFFLNKSENPRMLEFQAKKIESGSVHWFRIEITPIRGPHGKVKRHLSILKDITEIKEKNDQIKHLDLLGVIGKLAAGIAHEIKNPLTSVKGFVQLLSEETKSSYSEIILSELERIEEIMGEFLLLAKPQREIKFKKESITDILKEVLIFMQPEAAIHNVKFHCQLHMLPPVVCHANQMKQVFINLLKNAIEAMPSGGNVYIKTFQADDNYVGIEILDEGKGLSKEDIARLKEPFFTNKEKGTGLGLMVSFKIIEDHQGALKFFAEKGKGTRVHVLLPLKMKNLNELNVMENRGT